MTVGEYKEETVRIRPLLLGVARKYMGNDDDAEDVVQDILLRLWQIRESLYLPVDRLAVVLVRNRCIDLLRQRHGADVEIADIAEEQTADDERMESLLRAVDALPQMQQTVIRLRHMEGMEMQDIAELVGTTEVAVRKTLSRARLALKDYFLKKQKL